MSELQSTSIALDNQTLSDYRKEGLFTDVVFDANGTKYPVHKIVLAARSNVFKTMFTNGMQESSSNAVIKIKGLGADAFGTFLDYLYTGDARLVEVKPFELLMLADKYNVHALLDDCDSFLIDNICLENLCDYFTLLQTIIRPRIKLHLMKFVRQNIERILLHNEEIWDRLKHQFKFWTEIVESLTHFLAFQKYTLTPDMWARGDIRGPDISLVCDGQKVICFMTFSADERGEAFEAKIHLKDAPVIAACGIMLDLTVQLNRREVKKENVVLLWRYNEPVVVSKVRNCAWVCEEHDDLAPTVITCPCSCLFVNDIKISVTLCSIRLNGRIMDPLPPPRSFFELEDTASQDERSSRLLWKNLFDIMLDFKAISNADGNVNIASDWWKSGQPILTIVDAIDTLSRAIPHSSEKNNILNFIKFHAIDIIKDGDWALLKVRPDLLADILLQMVRCHWFFDAPLP